jgi:hypothetical protein
VVEEVENFADVINGWPLIVPRYHTNKQVLDCWSGPLSRWGKAQLISVSVLNEVFTVTPRKVSWFCIPGTLTHAVRSSTGTYKLSCIRRVYEPIIADTLHLSHATDVESTAYVVIASNPAGPLAIALHCWRQGVSPSLIEDVDVLVAGSYCGADIQVGVLSPLRSQSGSWSRARGFAPETKQFMPCLYCKHILSPLPTLQSWVRSNLKNCKVCGICECSYIGHWVLGNHENTNPHNAYRITVHFCDRPRSFFWPQWLIR